VLAARIGALQRAEHRPRDRDGRAAVVLFSDQIELGSRQLVAVEAVEAEPVVHLGKAAGEDLRAVLVGVDVEVASFGMS
jgi:hypothetical protein